MTRRKPIAQVEVKVTHPEIVMHKLKRNGWRGYVMSKSKHLWLHGTVENVEKAITGAKIIRAIGQ